MSTLKCQICKTFCSASLLLSAAVIGNAYYQRQQFYPSVVYITKSNARLVGTTWVKLRLTSFINPSGDWSQCNKFMLKFRYR